MIPTPIVQQNQHQQQPPFLLSPFFHTRPHATTPYVIPGVSAINNSYQHQHQQQQQQQQHPITTPPVFPLSTPYTASIKQYSSSLADSINGLDATFTVPFGDPYNNNNISNNVRNNRFSILPDAIKEDTTATNNNHNNFRGQIPINSEFGEFSLDSIAPPATTDTNINKSYAEESVHGTSSPLIGSDYPPPDLISNNVEFKRTMRKWVSSKEKDDDFFEEEQRYLKSLQAKRLR